MIKRITIENYMAHKLTTLEPAQGVTVITGPNNAGKSAIVEAMRSIAQNPPYRHAIRHGAKNALIRVELDSGEIIEWSRTEKAAVYRILRPDTNGEPGAYVTETYAKFGRTPPQDVQDLLRLDLVETETGPVDIHVGNQRQPIFLIDQAGSQAASFFAASTEAAYLLKMQQALKTRTDRAKSKRKDVLLECAKAEKQLEGYDILDTIDPTLRKAEELYDGIQVNERALPSLADFVDVLEDTETRHQSKTCLGALLSILSQPPELLEILPLEIMANESERLFESLDFHRVESEILARIEPPPVLHEIHSLEKLVLSIASSEQGMEAASGKNRVLQKTLTPPQLKEVSSLEALTQNIRTTAFRTEAAGFVTEALSRLLDPPALSDTLALDVLIANLSRTERLLGPKLSLTNALADIQPPPVTHEVRELEEMALFFDARLRGHATALAKSNVLQGILPPPEAKDLQPLERLIAALEAGRVKAGLSEEKCEILAELKAYPALQGIQELEIIISTLASTQARLDRIDASSTSLAGIRPLPALAPIQELSSAVERLSSLQQAQARMEQLQRSHEEALLAKRLEIEKIIEGTSICPLCGQTMDSAHFLEGVHAR